MIQQAFDFSDAILIELVDADGDVLQMNRYADPTKAICRFLKCSQKKAQETLQELRKEYQVYCTGSFQIVLAQGERVIYNFELCGETWYKGHKYNPLQEWNFKKLCDGIKPKINKAPKPKQITITATERQVRKARQLFYAKTIGFDISGKDYQRWHLL